MVFFRQPQKLGQVSPRSHQPPARNDDVFAGVLFLAERQVTFPILVSLHGFILDLPRRNLKRFIGYDKSMTRESTTIPSGQWDAL
jgi:hypothetical protein